MKRAFLLAACVATAAILFSKKHSNNVCKTFWDYYSNRDSNANCYHNPEHELTVPEIIERNGYPVEIHDVTTEDGYILNLFRIPHGKTKERGQEGPPVYLQHGFGSSSACFVNIGPKSLGFILADAGYDVWLGNFRGSTYGRRHERLDDGEPDFWDFSVHENGVGDLPALLNRVRTIRRRKITYIGYSMGTMAFYVYGSLHPDAAKDQIEIFVNLAPTAFVGRIRTMFRHLLPLWPLVAPVLNVMTKGKMYPRSAIPPDVLRTLCYPYPIQMWFCQIFDRAVLGANADQLDPETNPVSFIQNADWTSIKCFTHLVQLVLSGNFQFFDYGPQTNADIYGTPQPPHYNLSRVAVPTYFVRGENDLIITKEDVDKLYAALPKEAKPYDIYVVKDENFHHHNFIAAKDVVPLLYDHLVAFLHNHHRRTP